LLIAPALAFAAGSEEQLLNLYLIFLIVILGAVFGGGIARRVNQPAVLGELIFGLLAGNLGVYFGLTSVISLVEVAQFQNIFSDASGGLILREIKEHGIVNFCGMAILWFASSFGALLLLFSAGLETELHELIGVGKRALYVALIGALSPILLGLLFLYLYSPGLSLSTQLFVAAVSCATSIGITLRVLKDLKQHASQEAKLIIGAAVIDDVLGIIILSVLVGLVQTQTISFIEAAKLVAVALAFLAFLYFLGEKIAAYTVKLFEAFDGSSAKLASCLFLLVFFSWLAINFGLAAIIGAFGAGLILKDRLFKKIKDEEESNTLHQELLPLERLFAPIFFVLIGMQVDLVSIWNKEALILALGLIITATIGKLICAFAAQPGTRRAMVGFGMLPRGEVGLIFVSTGQTLGVMSESVFSASVIMIIVTTLAAPIGLSWATKRSAQ
jgi:Kef-type K+ transport system membrane component KefB